MNKHLKLGMIAAFFIALAVQNAHAMTYTFGKVYEDDTMLILTGNIKGGSGTTYINNTYNNITNITGGNTTAEVQTAVNNSGYYNITAQQCIFVNNATERAAFTTTFNATYDAKPSNVFNTSYEYWKNATLVSTFNATYDAKPSNTFNETYDAKIGFVKFEKIIVTKTSNINTTFNTSIINLSINEEKDTFIECRLIETGASASVGVQLQINYTNSTDISNPTNTLTYWNSTSSLLTLSGTGYSTTLSALSSAGASRSLLTIDAFYAAGNKSTMEIWMKSEVAGSNARIHAGSWCRSMEV